MENNASKNVQHCKRVVLTGGATAIPFEYNSGRYLVKNFSGGDIYVSFEPTVDEEISFRISNGYAQVCVINEKGTGYGQSKTDTIYIKGVGEVEVQQLWY